jgi:hypothetical protein
MLTDTTISNEAQATPWQTITAPNDGSMIVRHLDANGFLKAEYGIPSEGAFWLLYKAPYRPEPASYRDVYFPATDSTVKTVDGWTKAAIREAARHFMAECFKVTACFWSHRKVAGRFRIRPPADLVLDGSTPMPPCAERPRAGRKVPRHSLKRISPDDLADFGGFADDWAEGKLEQPSLSLDDITNLAFMKYGLPRDAVHLAIEFEPYKPEPVEWLKPWRPRVGPIGIRWHPEDAHRAVLAFIAECKRGTGQRWSHPHVKKRFKLTPPVTR